MTPTPLLTLSVVRDAAVVAVGVEVVDALLMRCLLILVPLGPLPGLPPRARLPRPSTSWKRGMLRSTVRQTSHQPHAHTAASRHTASSTRAEYSSQSGAEDDSCMEADMNQHKQTTHSSNKLITRGGVVKVERCEQQTESCSE